MSLSILVTIEMFNAMNALSFFRESLLTMPLWKNMKLIYAICLSMVLHFGILYIPFLQTIFSIEALNMAEWKAVLWMSAPVILIDEVLKVVERRRFLNTATSTHAENGAATEMNGHGANGAANGNGKVKSL